MDYEKAYRAALETAAQWIKGGCADKVKICLECCFPELRESEDERIRKELVYFIQREKEYMESKVKSENSPKLRFLMDALAYLEKQKEQKPAEWSEEDEVWLHCFEHLWEEDYKKDTSDIDAYMSGKRWLKSLRSKPHWKPSEEQIEALERAIVKVHTHDDIKLLAELRDNLKKL